MTAPEKESPRCWHCKASSGQTYSYPHYLVELPVGWRVLWSLNGAAYARGIVCPACCAKRSRGHAIVGDDEPRLALVPE